MVYQLVINAIRVYAPWIMLPITITVGYVGYKFEGWFRKPQALEPAESVEEIRLERKLKEFDAK